MRPISFVRLAVLGLSLALSGCLAAPADAAVDDTTVDHPIPVGPAVERAEPSKIAETAGAERVEPVALVPETHPTTTLGRSSPTTAR